ncbi:MAG: tRNA methyl transferase PRC-barrel domain-containing protein, partial [Planctomycetota bacterium]
PDSQEICFIPSGDYRQFVAERTTPTPGDIVDTDGNLLGRHEGIEGFTVGQRRGLGITSDRPLFVLSVDADRHRIVGRRSANAYPAAYPGTWGCLRQPAIPCDRRG